MNHLPNAQRSFELNPPTLESPLDPVLRALSGGTSPGELALRMGAQDAILRTMEATTESDKVQQEAAHAILDYEGGFSEPRRSGGLF